MVGRRFWSDTGETGGDFFMRFERQLDAEHRDGVIQVSSRFIPKTWHLVPSVELVTEDA